MDPRSNLQAILEAITSRVYFQPPEDTKMTYPCIVYNRSTILTRFADNHPYFGKIRYEIKVIDLDPDSAIVKQVWVLPLCSHDRSFVVDNLNHDVFTLFF